METKVDELLRQTTADEELVFQRVSEVSVGVFFIFFCFFFFFFFFFFFLHT
jgi:hypothetical protein